MQNKAGIILIFGLIAWILLLQALFLAEAVNPEIYSKYGETIRYMVIIYVTATHLVAVVLILIEINDLEAFHIDKFTIVTLILGSFLQQRLEIAGGSIFRAVIALAGVVLVIVWFRRKPNFLRTDMYWTLFAVMVSGLVVIAIAFGELILRQNWATAPLLQNNLFVTVSNLIVRELFATALLEEILFRGFFWGYLKRLGWEDNKLIWAQGLVFWMTHFGRIFTPFTFFVIIPIITFISSQLRSRSAQVFPAIVSHSVINILTALLNLATY